MIPIQMPEKWTVTFISDPEEAMATYTDTAIGNSYRLDEPSSVDGYEFSHFRLSDGSILNAGETISYSGKNVTVYIVWIPVITIDSSTGSANLISAALQNLSAGNYIIDLSAGSYSEENDIEIKTGQNIAIRATSASETIVSSAIKLQEGSSVALENITLQKADASLIEAETGGVAISVDSSILNASGTGRGIDVTVPVGSTGDEVHIAVSNSVINVAAAATGPVGTARGIDINNYTYELSSPFAGRLEALILDLDNVSINDTTGGSTIGVCIANVDYMDVDMTGCTIGLQNIHYATCIDTCGTSDRRSSVDIDGCTIKGWYCVYLRDACIGFDVNVKDSDLTTINTQKGNNNGIAVMQMHDSQDCIITANDSHMLFGNIGDEYSEGLIFGFQYNNDVYTKGGNCRFVINGCDFTLNRPMTARMKFAAIDNFTYTDNYVRNTYEMDSYSINSLLNLIPGTEVFPVTQPFTVDGETIDFTEYFLQ